MLPLDVIVIVAIDSDDIIVAYHHSSFDKAVIDSFNPPKNDITF
jgi:hypothetical protein